MNSIQVIRGYGFPAQYVCTCWRLIFLESSLSCCPLSLCWPQGTDLKCLGVNSLTESSQPMRTGSWQQKLQLPHTPGGVTLRPVLLPPRGPRGHWPRCPQRHPAYLAQLLLASFTYLPQFPTHRPELSGLTLQVNHLPQSLVWVLLPKRGTPRPPNPPPSHLESTLSSSPVTQR